MNSVNDCLSSLGGAGFSQSFGGTLHSSVHNVIDHVNRIRDTGLSGNLGCGGYDLAGSGTDGSRGILPCSGGSLSCSFNGLSGSGVNDCGNILFSGGGSLPCSFNNLSGSGTDGSRDILPCSGGSLSCGCNNLSGN